MSSALSGLDRTIDGIGLTSYNSMRRYRQIRMAGQFFLSGGQPKIPMDSTIVENHPVVWAGDPASRAGKFLGLFGEFPSF